MYDMYPWDSDSQGDYPPEPLRSWRDPNPREASPVTSPAQAVQAVQTALDRRDNGGAATAPHNAAPHAAPPTTSLTRQ